MGSAAHEPALKKARTFSVIPLSVDINGFSNGNGVGGQDQTNGDLDCRRFGTPEGCPYGNKCRFKHGPADERNIEHPVSALGSKTKPCTKFFSTSGCPYGEGCHFLHYVPGGIAALGLMPLGVSVTPTAPTPTSGMRSVHAGFGPTSNTPLLASSTDPSVTIGGYKTRLCNKFSTPEGCRFGEKCHFAHGETDLRPSNVRSNCVDYSENCTYQNWLHYLQEGAYANGGATHLLPPVATAIYYGEPTPPGVPGVPAAAAAFGLNNGNTKMSIEAVLAGAIIGKAGANVKQISRLTGCKLSIRDHESDASMRNVEMEGTYEQIERATEMVRQFLSYREVVPLRAAAIASHNYKTKLCENFSQGTCTFADRCHFAHGASELRPLTRL